MRYLNILSSLVLLTTFVAGQSVFVPVAELKTGGLLGGVENGRRVVADRAARILKDQTEFVLVGKWGIEEGGVSLGKLIRPEPNEPCEDFYGIEFELKMDAGVAIGSNAKWKIMPRTPKELGTDNSTYKTIVANFLKGKGIPKPDVKITRIVRIDLDGNGTDEVLISATRYSEGVVLPSAKKGDYSFVMLRTTHGKAVTSHLLEGEFYTKPVEFGAPNRHDISAVADLDGDGKMEVVLNGFYYEGSFASVFEMKNGRPVEIKEFRIGCGL